MARSRSPLARVAESCISYAVTCGEVSASILLRADRSAGDFANGSRTSPSPHIPSRISLNVRRVSDALVRQGIPPRPVRKPSAPRQLDTELRVRDADARFSKVLRNSRAEW
jgi:hypothetical protein